MLIEEEGLWQITGLSDEPVELSASDWLSALGTALRAEGRLSALGGLACEQLSSGVIIVHDMRHRARYVLQRQGAPAAISLVCDEVIPLHEAHGMPSVPAEQLTIESYDIEDHGCQPRWHAPRVETLDAAPYTDFGDPCEEVTVMVDRAALR
jgi:hypothetical protein